MKSTLFIGLMSGTSLDGVDAVVIDTASALRQIGEHFLPYPTDIKEKILKLQHPAANELETAALLSNELACLYAQAVKELLNKYQLKPSQIQAIGCHGQTIRHQPQFNGALGFSLQIGNAALLSEKTKITVVSDFRSRDIAAGGQGAPLVPAFHDAVFSSETINRAIINIGGIANITYLPRKNDKEKHIIGFDSGPGNMLIDAWTKIHTGKDYDENGQWAASGQCIKPLLDKLLFTDFFQLHPPKSTGRDLFHLAWLKSQLLNIQYAPEDVATTLINLTAETILDAIRNYCGQVEELYLCGGGAHNHYLSETIKCLAVKKGMNVALFKTDALNICADWVESFAFAWLAKKCIDKEPANNPLVTGSAVARILGTITQA